MPKTLNNRKTHKGLSERDLDSHFDNSHVMSKRKWDSSQGREREREKEREREEKEYQYFGYIPYCNAKLKFALFLLTTPIYFSR